MTDTYTTGALLSPHKDEDWLAQAYLPAEAIPVPAELDLRSICQPVRNQGSLGSCTAFAVGSGAMGSKAVVAGEPGRIYSPSWLYYGARAQDHADPSGQGSYLSSVLEYGRLHGLVLEGDLPYTGNPTQNLPVGKDGPAHATANRIDGYAKVERSVDAIIQNLLAHGPLPIVVDCLDGFMYPGRGGLVSATGKSHGLHATTLVGFKVKEQVWIVRNSWGPSWADAGYCYVPWSYEFKEAWAILAATVIHDGVHPGNFPFLAYLANALGLHIPGIN